MFLQLQDSTGHLQLQRGLLRATLPEALWRFIEAGAPEWDAAIDGSLSEAPRIPTPGEVDLRSLGASARHAARDARPHRPIRPAATTGRSRARVRPTVRRWSRTTCISACGCRTSGTGPGSSMLRQQGFDEVGLTLPGAPTLVVGSNGHIAWGFTNSYGEFSKVIRLVPVPGDRDAYATAGGNPEAATMSMRSSKSKARRPSICKWPSPRGVRSWERTGRTGPTRSTGWHTIRPR